MARTSNLNSTTSQFNLNVTDNSVALGQINNWYMVFGTLVQGLALLDAVGNSATGPSVITGGILAYLPLIDIVLQSATKTQLTGKDTLRSGVLAESNN